MYYHGHPNLMCLKQYLLPPLQYLCSFHQTCCKDPVKCIALICYGKFLTRVIAGWDDKECTRTFETLGHNTLVLKHLSNIMNSKPGMLISSSIAIMGFCYKNEHFKICMYSNLLFQRQPNIFKITSVRYFLFGANACTTADLYMQAVPILMNYDYPSSTYSTAIA